MVIHTTIIHQTRVKLGLSCNEYCVADMIYHLSKNGWCKAHKQYLSKIIGISKTNISLIINKLIKKNIITKHDKNSWFQTTEKWNTK